MKIIFDSESISVNDVSLNKHVVAGTDKHGDVVLLRRKMCGGESFIAAIMTKSSLQSGNAYSGNGATSLHDVLDFPDIQWHAFDTMKDFFLWAAEAIHE